jgi:putative DNA primase/helicase
VVRACALLEQNDTDNGRRLIEHFGHDMVQVRDVGPHIWTGTHWEPEGAAEAFARLAQRTAKRISLEAFYIDHTEEERATVQAAEAVDTKLLNADGRSLDAEKRAAQALARQLVSAADEAAASLRRRRSDRRRFAIASGNTQKLEGMIKQAAVHHTLPPEAMDADPLVINVLNGTLRLVKEWTREVDPDCPDPNVTRYIDVVRWRVRLDPHQRGDHIAKLMQVNYDPSAVCPKWDAFLVKFQPQESVRLFLRLFFGYAMTGLTGIRYVAEAPRPDVLRVALHLASRPVSGEPARHRT